MPRRTGQAGLSLVELLLAILLTTLMVGPLTLWVTLAMRQQPVTEADLTRTSAEGLIGMRFPRDVEVAAAAAVDDSNDEVNFEDCIGGAGSGGRRLLAFLAIIDQEPRKVMYVEAPLRDGGAPDPTRRSIWRRECRASDGQQTESSEVLVDVVPSSSTASCPQTSAAAPCRQVRVVTTPRGGSELELLGTRRVDAASLRFDRTGNRVPVPKISVVSQTVTAPFTVELSPTDSYDPDGQILRYEWVLPRDPYQEGVVGDVDTVVETLDRTTPPAAPPVGSPRSVTWDAEGTYFVQLLVTDDRGAQTSTYKRVEVSLPAPVAEAQVTPLVGVAGLTEFGFAAQWPDPIDGTPLGSSSPAGLPLTFRWQIATPPPDPLDVNGNPIDPPPVGPPDTDFGVVRASGEEFRAALPVTMQGLVFVTLTVTDSVGRSSSVTTEIELTPPAPVPPPDPVPPAVPLAANPVVQLDGSLLRWGPVPGAVGYRIEYQHAGCGAAQTSTAYEVAPDDSMSAPVLPDRCPAGGASTATVVAIGPVDERASASTVVAPVLHAPPPGGWT